MYVEVEFEWLTKNVYKHSRKILFSASLFAHVNLDEVALKKIAAMQSSEFVMFSNFFFVKLLLLLEIWSCNIDAGLILPKIKLVCVINVIFGKK